MASHLKDILEPGERLLLITHLHWIYLLSGLSWFGGMAGIGLGLDYLFLKFFGFFEMDIAGFDIQNFQPIIWLCMAAGAAVFTTDFIKYISSRVVLTSRQLIYKHGFINVKIDETDLSDVKAVHLDQGILGHILGYGMINLDCRFVGDVYLPVIPKPYKFIKTLQAVRASLEHEGKDDLPKPARHAHA